jgi:3-hydroxyisobutyrate dehydrogenase-like beta-hydroxyacid dehydrogenase
MEKAAGLTRLGARAALSVESAVADAGVVLVNVIDYEASESILAAAGKSGALKDKLIVELSSGTPAQARDAADRVREWGAGYLDGAIMATPNFIGTSGGLILFSGESGLFSMHADTLVILGGAGVYVGEDPGRASALDMALLTQMWGALFGTLHALAICDAEGLPLDDFEHHRQSFRPVVEGAVSDLACRVRDERLDADEQTLAAIAAHGAAFHHVMNAAAGQGIDPDIISPWNRLFIRADQAGLANADFAALARLLRPAS